MMAVNDEEIDLGDVTLEEATSRPCTMCLTFIEWFRDAWLEDATDPTTAAAVAMPEFAPRKAEPILKIQNEGRPMPFCAACARLYMQALAWFQQELQARQQREGTLQQTGMNVAAQPGIATPTRSIILPGQPGFKAP